MKTLGSIIKRNTKLFFKDKGLFFTSLITPLILLVLYATFLANVYRDSLQATFPQGVSIPKELLEGCGYEGGDYSLAFPYMSPDNNSGLFSHYLAYCYSLLVYYF